MIYRILFLRQALCLSRYLHAGGNVGNDLRDAIAGGRIVSNAGARIDILNRTPLSMSINDAIIEDNRRIESVGGGLLVFTPGNVYFNGQDLTGHVDDTAQDITILQDALLTSEYDLDGFVLPDTPQDLYIAGDVINENGDVTISNREGSINVSGVIRGEQVDVASAKNFSLNTEGWLHTNQDPRQYIDYTADQEHGVRGRQGAWGRRRITRVTTTVPRLREK